MKLKVLFLMSAAILLVPLLATCDIITGDFGEPAGDNDYAAAGLTDEEVRIWEERGNASVETAEQASALVGFKVVTPGYIPDSFLPRRAFMLADHNTRLRGTGFEAKFDWKAITQTYTYTDFRLVSIVFIQSTNPFNTGHPTVEICGRTMEKKVTPARNVGKTDPPTSTDQLPGIAYGWEQNGIWYYVEGYLHGPLDEATLQKVVCSINP